MRLTDLAAWPDDLTDLRFSPADQQPDAARRLIVLANNSPLGQLDVCPTGWHLTITTTTGTVEHVFVASDRDAAFDMRALAIWAVMHVLRALSSSMLGQAETPGA